MIFCIEEEKNKQIIANLKNKTHSQAAKDAIDTADELADLILFHQKVKQNSEIMSQPWLENEW